MPDISTKVHGGVIDDQMLKGSISFFQMTGGGNTFDGTISDGNIIIPGLPRYGGTNTVGSDKPVPRSAAEIAFQVIMSKATIVQVKLIDGADVIQFAIENEDDGLDTTDAATPSDAAANMTAALLELETVTVPDNTNDGKDVIFDGADTITVISKEFVLAP